MATSNRARRALRDDDDDGVSAADDRLIAEVRTKARRAPRDEDIDDDEPDRERPAPRRRADETEIDLEDDDDDDDDEGGDDDIDDERPSRRARRSNRFREVNDRAAALEASNAELTRQLAQLTGGVQTLVQLNGRQQAPQGPQGPTKAELDLKSARERQVALQREFSRLDPKTITPEVEDRYMARAHELENEVDDIKFDIRMEKRGVRPVDPRQQSRDNARQTLVARHPELMSDRRLGDLADGHFQLLKGRGAKPDVATWDKAILAAKRELGIGEFAAGAQPGRRADPSRYEGVPRGSARTTRDNKGGKSGSKFMMTAEFKNMAENLYPKEKKEVAWRKWAKEVGVKMRANG